jgi:hypothetical protein
LQRRLENYLTAKRRTEKFKPQKNRRANEICCADGQRVDALLDCRGEMTVNDIDEDSCADFIDVIGSASLGISWGISSAARVRDEGVSNPLTPTIYPSAAHFGRSPCRPAVSRPPDARFLLR